MTRRTGHKLEPQTRNAQRKHQRSPDWNDEGVSTLLYGVRRKDGDESAGSRGHRKSNAKRLDLTNGKRRDTAGLQGF